MVSFTRRDALRALPALAAGLGGCSALSDDDHPLPVPTRWQIRFERPTPVVQPANGPLLGSSRSPFEDDPVLSGRDPETGDELWSVSGEAGRASPIGADDAFAYVFTWGGEAFAVDYRRGEVEWRVPIAPIGDADPGVVQYGPIPVGDRVVVPVSGTEEDVRDRLEAFDRATGEQLFEHDLASSLSGAPAADGAGVLVPLLDGTLRRISADGTEDWRVDLGTPVSDVTVADVSGSAGGSSDPSGGGTAYVGSPTEHLLAVDAATGEELWRGPLENATFTRPLVVDDRVYVGGADHYLSAFDRASGDRQWRSELSSAVTVGPTLLDDRLITLAGGSGQHRGPAGTTLFSPPALYVHDVAGEQIGRYGFEGYVDGGSITWAAATDGGVYLGQEWKLSRLDREVLDAE